MFRYHHYREQLVGYRRVRTPFEIYFHWLGWRSIAFGISLDLRWGNIELHLPFCFIRIGWNNTLEDLV